MDHFPFRAFAVIIGFTGMALAALSTPPDNAGVRLLILVAVWLLGYTMGRPLPSR